MSEGFSNKEMLIKIIDQNEQFLITQTKILSHSENVDNHLELLNSKVASHEGKIKNLGDEHIKARTVFGTLSVLLTGAWAVVTFILK